ncbi:MAG TPA: DEAD/DEAH box helicase [Gaiellaceae bacterium]|nr:DEAD/DEAH box helicase [Gaiellaceae bacterium]
MSQQSFRALGVSDEVAQALAARDITYPFPIQALVLREAFAGSDLLAKAPTGSGKTLAFGLPIVERGGRGLPSALVLVPTRELATQVSEELGRIAKPKGLHVAAVYGGAPIGAQQKRAREANVLVATPGRLQDLIDRRMVKLHDVAILILDEADRMLDMGFKPQVEKIMRSLPTERQTMLFSATLDGEVGELARSYTRNPAHFEAALPVEQEGGEVDHRFVSVTADGKVEALIAELENDRVALVFVRTKRGADRLVQKLTRRGIDAVAMHGDLTQRAREKALARFSEGKVTTLVATDVAARGLDLSGITHVINFDPPEDDKGYVHRVGRTGRAGRSGSGITLVLPEQQADVSRVVTRLGHREEFEDSGMSVARPRKVYSSRRGRGSRW